MQKKKSVWMLAAVIAAGAAFFVGGDTIAQGRLLIGGSQSNFGSGRLEGGFMPDPFMHNIRSGGRIDVSTLALAPGCRGYVTARPDYILQYSNAASFIRFFFRTNNANGPRNGRDTTLVINDASGRWHCDDDGGGNFNPMVDIRNPPSGQYDIWVGTYDGSGQFVDGQLGVTELRSQRP